MFEELEYIDKRIQYVENLAKPVEYKIPVAPQPIKVKINHEAAFEEEIQTLNNIKQALLELQAIKEAKPSEALKCLNKIVESFNETSAGMYGLGEVVVANDLIYGFKKELETIQATLLKSQENKRVLKVIKEKCLYNHNLNYVAVCINYDMYKEKMSKKYDTAVVKTDWNDKDLLDCLKLLTQEDFDTLKRWLDEQRV